MELTPELLDEQEFPVVLRGYDTASVDDFLERVGAGLGVLLDRLDQAGNRMAEMEAQLAERPTGSAQPPAFDFQGQVDQVSRALVLAQEAADQTTAEARAEADRLVAQARATADGLVAQANADVEARVSTAESEVEERAAALRAVRDKELVDLAAQQQRAEAETVRLRHELDEQRRHLQAVAAAAQSVLDGPALAGRGEPDPPRRPDPAAATDEPEPAAAQPSVEEPVVEEPLADEAIADEPVADEAIAEEPVVEEPAVEEPAVAEPITHEPIAAEPTGGEPTFAPPLAEEPSVEEPAVAEPPSAEQHAAEPAIEVPTAISAQAPAVEATTAPDALAGVAAVGPAEPPTEPIRTIATELDDGGPVPADQSMFWRATEAAEQAGIDAPLSGVFDQDDEAVLPPAAPLLRAVEPPDDDPFLAALRGDDDAAARLADRTGTDEEPAGLMRRLRRG